MSAALVAPNPFAPDTEKAIAELQRLEAPGARRRVIQLLKDAARLDTRARLLRAGES